MKHAEKAVAQLDSHAHIWETKPVLRTVYLDYYQRIVNLLTPGRVLEIGAGTGHLRSKIPGAILTDIQAAPWLDVTADAQSLPFQSETFDNIAMLDVLHHIENPNFFFSEARRILKPGGRMIMIEPAITLVSKLFYHYLHPEPVNMQQDPLANVKADPNRKPYDANQAIPTLLFRRNKRKFANKYPDLKVHLVENLSLFAYPLSGGYREWSLIPQFLVCPILQLENYLMPLLGNTMAFRILIMIERR